MGGAMSCLYVFHLLILLSVQNKSQTGTLKEYMDLQDSTMKVSPTNRLLSCSLGWKFFGWVLLLASYSWLFCLRKLLFLEFDSECLIRLRQNLSSILKKKRKKNLSIPFSVWIVFFFSYCSFNFFSGNLKFYYIVLIFNLKSEIFSNPSCMWHNLKEITLQDFTVLPTAKFRRCVIRSSSVIFYRHHHRRNKSVGFTFVGDSSFCRYISRKNKKIIYRRFYRRNVRAKKKRFPLEIYRRIFIPSVTLKLPTENLRRYIGRWMYEIPTEYVRL